MYLKRVRVTGYRAASSGSLECVLPGRFSVLAGANSGGKSTIADAIVLAHRDVFPGVQRPTSAMLSRNTTDHELEVEYHVDQGDPSPLAGVLLGHAAPTWLTTLSPSMGRVVATRTMPLDDNQLPVLYLSPLRDPVRDLAGREARLIVELLRAQALKIAGDKSLVDLRIRVQRMMERLVSFPPVAQAEATVMGELGELTSGVSRRQSFLASSYIDDTFLSRVLEFVISTGFQDRLSANRLETEGLGYANLLQIAVILAAIPDLAGPGGSGDDLGDTSEQAANPPATGTDEDEADQDAAGDGRSDEDRRAELETADRRRDEESDTFFASLFHGVIVLEEPEAHLHPQLQRSLIAYLREVVTRRPELQLIVTTHSDQVVAACDPTELVIFGRDPSGHPACRTVADLGLTARQLAQARRHLDASRSASIFASHGVVVEGTTDAVVLRALGRVWAAQDRDKQRFVDALSITVAGSRVGDWLPSLLCSANQAVVRRLAVLADSDGKPEPGWVSAKRGDCFEYFMSEPTLEPSLVDGNEGVIFRLVDGMIAGSLDWPGGRATPDLVRKWFGSKGKRRKAAFADLLSQRCQDHPDDVTVPSHIAALLDFLWDDFAQEAADPSRPTGDEGS